MKILHSKQKLKFGLLYCVSLLRLSFSSLSLNHTAFQLQSAPFELKLDSISISAGKTLPEAAKHAAALVISTSDDLLKTLMFPPKNNMIFLFFTDMIYQFSTDSPEDHEKAVTGTDNIDNVDQFSLSLKIKKYMNLTYIHDLTEQKDSHLKTVELMKNDFLNEAIGLFYMSDALIYTLKEKYQIFRNVEKITYQSIDDQDSNLISQQKRLIDVAIDNTGSIDNPDGWGDKYSVKLLAFFWIVIAGTLVAYLYFIFRKQQHLAAEKRIRELNENDRLCPSPSSETTDSITSTAPAIPQTSSHRSIEAETSVLHNGTDRPTVSVTVRYDLLIGPMAITPLNNNNDDNTDNNTEDVTEDNTYDSAAVCSATIRKFLRALDESLAQHHVSVLTPEYGFFYSSSCFDQKRAVQTIETDHHPSSDVSFIIVSISSKLCLQNPNKPMVDEVVKSYIRFFRQQPPDQKFLRSLQEIEGDVSYENADELARPFSQTSIVTMLGVDEWEKKGGEIPVPRFSKLIKSVSNYFSSNQSFRVDINNKFPEISDLP